MTGSARRLLIVEDDPLIAAFMTKALRTKGYSVTAVGTGSEGLATVAAGVVDLLLLDLGLPDMDGLEVLRVVRDAGELPVLVVTSRSDPNDRATALSLGVSGYIVKPFPLTSLLVAVQDALKTGAQVE